MKESTGRRNNGQSHSVVTSVLVTGCRCPARPDDNVPGGELLTQASKKPTSKPSWQEKNDSQREKQGWGPCEETKCTLLFIRS